MSQQRTQSKVVYLSHGGGPLPLLGDADHKDLVAALKKIARQIEKPEAIVIFSAHWESDSAVITGAANPSLIYDYYGFPAESYHIQYPLKGNPSLAKRIQALLEQQGVSSQIDMQRGFDHGVFVPLKIMYPDADIPCVQVSLLRSLDPLSHIKLGRALQTLSTENILFIGSGLSFHNLKQFFSPHDLRQENLNHAFEDWLEKTITNADLKEHERTEELTRWRQAPGAAFCHPREEHLLPLHVCYGIANRAAKESVSLHLFGKRISCVIW